MPEQTPAEPSPPVWRQQAVHYAIGFASTFLAVFLATLFSGLLLLATVRLYVGWEVARIAERMGKAK